ncbi:4Fe-4S single cluster domain-containing protein [Leptotrichia sp. oral taxon 212]|jgi:anaerobic ribonucleoside-triphosphate reductase-activating protein|uniref:4Fe-4S single cluster domain-containing protein n=1 Tax=Leptotrichia sp. oral taxon 212 TaxID=712357 RepID=UPI0006A9DB1A|nr:4Fe-4S single cluster domain-containing protein [Leptotrichia sp. oral taxon 212]ALA95533.1 hypothetical protein AMK43_05365 [Leptotrichia sp. oral taxon 212]
MPKIQNFSKEVYVLGPGKRFVIWYQGCLKNCRNCINQDGRKLEGGIFYSNNQLFELIMNEKELTGVTLSGGEPFIQFDEVFELIKAIKENTDLDIIIYTGYKLNELIKKYGNEFCEYIDILIDGEYIEELDHGEELRGSSNQKIHFLSNKYKKAVLKLEESQKREIQFDILGNNELFMIGIPPKGFYEKLLKELKKEII